MWKTPRNNIRTFIIFTLHGVYRNIPILQVECLSTILSPRMHKHNRKQPYMKTLSNLSIDSSYQFQLWCWRKPTFWDIRLEKSRNATPISPSWNVIKCKNGLAPTYLISRFYSTQYTIYETLRISLLFLQHTNYYRIVLPIVPRFSRTVYP